MTNRGSLNLWIALGAGVALTQACVISDPPVDLSAYPQAGGATGSNGGADRGGNQSATGGHGGAGGYAGNMSGVGGVFSSGGAPDARAGAPPVDAGPDAEPVLPCAPCASGLCLDGGVCAECTSDAQCGSPAPRCNTVTHTCVTCLPGPTDNCGATEFCDGTTLTCSGGCKSDDACASGTCNANHDCAPCLTDSECSGGRLCSSGQCLPACGGGAGCPADFTCCTTRCADLAYDRDACGACGVTCTSSAYCSATGCKSNSLSNVCDLTHATVLLDAQTTDDAASHGFGSLISAGCSSTPGVHVESQDTSNALNQKTGRPTSNASDLVVQIGGPFGQRMLRYLENNGVTKVYSVYGSGFAGFNGRSSTGGTDPTIIDAPRESGDAGPTAITDSHDIFVIETIVDPTFGGRTLAVYGLFAPGTNAGMWFFQHRVLPSIGTFTGSYYVYEWTDKNGNLAPDDTDTFRLVKSGS